MLPASIIKRTYILASFIVTVLMLVFGWINIHDNEELIIKENTTTLLKIANMLEQRLPNSYETILRQEGSENLSDQEKARVLNKKLQPIINEVSGIFPGCGMGYGMYRQLIAFHPYNEANFTKQTSDVAMRVYETKTTEVIFNPRAAVWHGEPSLSINYPLYYNGRIIGHVWANIKLEKVNQQITLILGRNLLIFIVAWLILLLMLKQMFRRIGNGLTEFALEIGEDYSNKSNLQYFPELHPVQNLLETKVKESLSNRIILDTITDALIIFNNQLDILFLNRAAKNMFSLSDEAIGLNFTVALPHANPIFQERFLKSIELNQPQEFRAECYCTGNWTETNSYPSDFGLIACIRDISDKRMMERELQRLDRLHTVGEMAASIGHEVRNPMTTVRGYLQYFSMKDKFAEYADQISTMVEELDRANEIITEFLSLAKNKAVEMKPGNLNGTINALYPLLMAEAFRMGHQLETVIGELPTLYYDDKEIRQLILNLARNGMEAMSAGGVLTIKTYLEHGKATLVIQDTGKGIPEEILDKAWYSFYDYERKWHWFRIISVL